MQNDITRLKVDLCPKIRFTRVTATRLREAFQKNPSPDALLAALDYAKTILQVIVPCVGERAVAEEYERIADTLTALAEDWNAPQCQDYPEPPCKHQLIVDRLEQLESRLERFEGWMRGRKNAGCRKCGGKEVASDKNRF